jgi:poly(3-hydroxyalkanoate) depolymerase
MTGRRKAQPGSGADSGLRRVMPGRAGPGDRVRTLSIGGRVLRVAVRDGNPAWPPLLLCNGIGAPLELFQPFVDALDPQRPIVRFDMPGIGGSPARALPYHLATLPPLLNGLLDQLGYPRADVLGISWGGGLAQQFALSRPDRVRRLVLVATGPGALMVPGHPRALLHMLTPRRHHDPGHAARIAGELYGGSVREDPALARNVLHATTPPVLARGYYYQLASGIGWTSLPRLPQLAQPTLILAGDDDPIIPLVNAKIMHRLIPHSELHIYHGGHLALATDAHQLAPAVEAFLTAGAADGTAAAPEQARRPRRRRVRAGGLRSRMLGRPADGARSANALRETRSLAVDALAAPIARVIALRALAALGLSGDPFHEPFHDRGPRARRGRGPSTRPRRYSHVEDSRDVTLCGWLGLPPGGPYPPISPGAGRRRAICAETGPADLRPRHSGPLRGGVPGTLHARRRSNEERTCSLLPLPGSRAGR